MKILAIDLGKFKSVACEYNSENGEHVFTTIATSPAAMHGGKKGSGVVFVPLIYRPNNPSIVDIVIRRNATHNAHTV